MSSMSGYINYIQYTTGSNKGAYEQGDVINSPFGLGSFKKGADGKLDTNYSANQVTEAKASTSAAGKAEGQLNWTPVVPGYVEFIVSGHDSVKDGGDGKLYEGRTATATGTQVGTIDYKTGEYTFTSTGITAATAVFANYVYDNVVIPQNDLPIINAEIKAIPLIAKARRIAIYYSQIAAFQAKTDYGFDLGDQLAEKAVGQLSYEIDTEVTSLLVNNAEEDGDLVFNKALPVGVSKAEHYEGFAELLGIAKQKIYDRTKRFSPNYILISSDILPILGFLRNFTAAPAGSVNGPYFAGTVDSLKVFVTPNIGTGTFVVGVNGDDMMSSAAVYAPYMPIVPTQLLGYADGGMSQGWSTLYDLKMLNANLLVKGSITNDPATANEQVINNKVVG